MREAEGGGWWGLKWWEGGEDGEGCEGATRGACRRSRRSDALGLLWARCWRDTGANAGRDETPVKSIMVTFAITAAIRAELALKKQFALY